ncbi:MAG: SHOCT domain-containing protein [Holophaga sp.]|nr:SHOCT domain-containing protein [Holophaga sp.]
MRRLPYAALALLMVPASLSAAKTKRLWDFAPYSFVRRSPAEKGAPANSQPIQVDGATLVQALGTVRVVTKAGEEPLFNPKEIETFAYPMAEALALAQPGDDLELLSTATRSRKLFGSSLAVTGRLFVQDGKLNLIVHDARLDFIYYVSLGGDWMPKFDFGSRTKKAADVVLKAPGGEVRRADWVVLPLVPPAPQAVSAPPAAVAQRIPATQPVPAAAPAPAVQPAASLRAVSTEEHLRELKRFREQGLITEEEYAKEKQDLLKAFSNDLGGGAAK